jgi:type 1 glutamine amidotransferase
MRMSFANQLTRRSLLRSIGYTGLGVAAASAKEKIVPTHATAFALCGDESHNSDYIRTALTSTLVEDAGLSIDFTDQEKLLSYDNLRHYKILIMFRDGLRFPNGYWHQLYWNEKKNAVKSDPPIQKKIGEGRTGWMTEEQGKGIKKWVEEGGSLWAYHNNSQTSSMNKDYRDVEGAIYTGHPAIRPFKVKIVNHDHPITKDVRDFIVTDEQHYVTYDKDPKYVLARSVNEDGLDYTDMAGRKSNTSESVWAYDYGKGRVCFTAPGHMISVLWNPEYEKLQRNAARWLLRET